VASDIGGVNESLQHGVTGVLVPPGDAVALASALANMADDSAQRNAMGAAGRARIASLFTMDRMVREVAQTYEEAIAQYAARKKNTP
ncbi:MAG TPA: glycosyltransferase, partial [Candidatus Hydrogenedentes bacterium]|nr:glycosyltransferase [Candidatus Hydrogenedentota bacterium]